MVIDEVKLNALLTKWERVPAGTDEDPVDVVLAHEVGGECAREVRLLMLEGAPPVQSITPAAKQDAVAGITHDIAGV